MKVVETDTGFCDVYGAPDLVIRYLQLSVPQILRYYTDEPVPHWRVHKDHVVHAVQLGYAVLGHVDYSGLGTELQMVIAQEKGSWTLRDTKKQATVTRDKSLDKLEAYATLFLTPAAPDFIIEAVWKALARKHHPDHGGDSEAFKTYNAAHKKIKRK